MIVNRQAKYGKTGEEYCNLVGSEDGKLGRNRANDPRTSFRFDGVNGRRFSTSLLVCCVFLSGVLFGFHLSNSNARGNYATNNNTKDTPRAVHVGSMCRCVPQRVPLPDVNKELISIYQQVPKNSQNIGIGQDTRIIQSPSKATGSEPKHFLHHPVEACQCFGGNGRIMPEPSTDKYLSMMSRDYFLRPENDCQTSEAESQYNWDQMPDFGVEDLPIFVGVLSYKSPLTLNNTLHNWLQHDLFHRIAAQDVFVQLNRRSREDDEILHEYQKKFRNRHPMTVLGSEEENLHPGLAISNFCRMAEEHPSSHPNGENLVLFLEKDWVIPDDSGKLSYLEALFRSAIALSQRGVPYVSLKGKQEEGIKMWQCAAEGVGWECTTAHHHRWTNHPALISCNWFLRYLEPFALLSLTDPIMTCGSSPAHKSNGYCDWEEVLQDGRVAWTNSQWVTAHLRNSGGGPLFLHKEVDE